MDFNLIIVAVATLLGSLGSSYLIGHFNTKSQDKALKIEFQRIDEERKYKEKQKLIEVYNFVLRKNGEVNLIETLDDGFLKMNLDIYSKEIRFALYEQYSKLDKEVAEVLTKLDKKIEELSFSFTYNSHDSQDLLDECCRIYFDLIKRINNVIDAQRERTQLRTN